MLMKFLLFCTLFAFGKTSTLEIFHAPPSVQFPSITSTLRTSQLPDINAFIIGLSSARVDNFQMSTELTSRPRVLTTIIINSLDELYGHGYQITADGINFTRFNNELRAVFKGKGEFVRISSGRVDGTELAKSTREQKGKAGVSLQLVPIYQLAAALRPSTNNTVDVILIELEAVSKDELKSAIEALDSALNAAYTENSLVEIVCISGHEDDQVQQRYQNNPEVLNLLEMRKNYQVYAHVSADYPAIFAIFAGVTITLIISLVYIIVAMFSFDPSKGSFLYKISTGRVKKE